MSEEINNLFEQTKNHAIRFRDRVAHNDPRPSIEIKLLKEAFEEATPETGMDGNAVIDQMVKLADQGLLPVTGPRFFSWVIGASHPVAVAADWMVSIWGQNSAIYHSAPACAAAEQVTGRWLVDLLKLPKECSVGFVSGATMANFVGLAAGRSEVLRRVNWDVEYDGLWNAPRIQVFVGEDAHASVYSALQYLGLGRKTVTTIMTDREGRMDADALDCAMEKMPGPRIVVAQAGQLNTGAIDPFDRIPEIAKRYGAWLHVDAAFGLWARASDDLIGLTQGIEQADSWAVDGHKWLQVPYDSGFIFVRDRKAHARAMSIAASYLPEVAEEMRQPSSYVPELSRRARVFPVWAIIKTLGREGIAEMVNRHCALANRLALRLDREPGIEVMNEVVLNQLTVGFGEGEAMQVQSDYARDVIAKMARENDFVLGGAEWKGRWILRVSIISYPSTENDIDAMADAIIRIWNVVKNGH